MRKYNLDLAWIIIILAIVMSVIFFCFYLIGDVTLQRDYYKEQFRSSCDINVYWASAWNEQAPEEEKITVLNCAALMLY